jgi:DNA-binding MurR/RpiR family transcriptional regulator
MTIKDRVDLPGIKGPGANRFQRVVFDEMNNIRKFYETVDMETLERFVKAVEESESVYLIGSRISYTYAYYMGWALTKVRKGIRILKGSDSAAIDWLANAPEQSLVVMIATSRYPNELIRLSKVVRRLGHSLFLIADSKLCPLIPFANDTIIAPSKSISLIGNPAGILCIANYIALELAGRSQDNGTDSHPEKLERIYLENDILFDLNAENLWE